LVLDDTLDAAERLVELGSSAGVALGRERSVDDQVLWNLTVLGEATKRLSAAVRHRYPDVPWTEMAETRDRVVHHYEGMDWEVVTQILREDLPPLLPRLREIRDELSAEADAAL
jgi:uncharacterized protein with HEPN domain